MPVTGAGDTTADRVFGQGAQRHQLHDRGMRQSAGAPAPSATGICDPIAISLDSVGNLFVADAFNNRVLEYNQPLAAFNAASGAGDVTADVVLGQGASGTDFVSSVCADSAPGDPAPSATAICQPGGVAMDSAGNLYVADQTNNRVLRFDDPIVPFTGPSPTASATATGSTPTPTATATADTRPRASATVTSRLRLHATGVMHRERRLRPHPPRRRASSTATATSSATATSTDPTATATRPHPTATATATRRRPTASIDRDGDGVQHPSTPTSTATATRRRQHRHATSTATADGD